MNPLCPVIAFSEEEIQSFYKPWSKALVVKVLEKAFSFPVTRRRLESLWARAGRIQVTDMANSFFLVRFSEEDDYQRALFKGPWKMAVERIGNHIGRTIRLDLATAEGARARYARVCIEVDLSKPLLGKYVIEDRVYLIEYESLDNICYSCGMYGHKVAGCSKIVIPAPTPPPEKESGVEPPIIKDAEQCEAVGNCGSWMTVKRRQRKPTKAPIPPPKSDQNHASRFATLAEESSLNDPPTSEPPIFPSQATEVQADPDTMAAELKEQLDQALNNDPANGKGSTKAKARMKKPESLSDITNTYGKQKSNAPKKTPNEALNSAGLVSVPVTFGNPVFQTSVPNQKAKPKSKFTLSASSTLGKPSVAATVKKFGPKLPGTTSSQVLTAITVKESRTVGGNSGSRPPEVQFGKNGEPPDRI
ncbi:hypothetical protein LINPERHAP2_LOCUS22176 [Linum perenne]